MSPLMCLSTLKQQEGRSISTIVQPESVGIGQHHASISPAVCSTLADGASDLQKGQAMPQESTMEGEW